MDVRAGLRAVRWAMGINVVLAAVKIGVGLIGSSYALVADGVESSLDLVSGLIVWSGLRIGQRPADAEHPYGHGKAESLAAAVAALALLGAGALIAIGSVHEIRTPHAVPAWYTLPVVAGILVIKEGLYRWLHAIGRRLQSRALIGDAWHHRSDALTSLAALLGISIAVIGGPAYATADDWAALLACGIIAFNGGRLLKQAVDEIMDRSADDALVTEIRALAGGVPGVLGIDQCRVRKSGLGLLMDIHVEVDGALSVTAGHAIGHRVKDLLIASHLPISDVVVHVEPFGE